MNENKRNRKISSEKKLLNLYIKYMRDYVKEEDYNNLKALKEEDKLKIKLYKDFEYIPDIAFFLNKYNKQKKEYEVETDGRKKKTKKRKLDEMGKKLKRVNEIKNQSKYKWLNFDMTWEELQEIREFYYEDFSIKIGKVEIYLLDLHQFDADFNIIGDFFQFDMNKKSTENIILDIFKHKALEFFEEYNMYRKIDLYIEYAQKIENAVKRLKNNSIYKQSAKKAFEKEPIGTDSYWLLENMFKYKERTGKTLSLKVDNLKSIFFHTLFKDWFDLETAKKILKNSSL